MFLAEFFVVKSIYVFAQVMHILLHNIFLTLFDTPEQMIQTECILQVIARGIAFYYFDYECHIFMIH